jgi:hypothetical protein
VEQDEYTLHLYSYLKESSATQEVSNLQRVGISAHFVECEDGWFRVYAGKYPSIKEAKTKIDSLLTLLGHDYAMPRKISRIK